MKVFPPFQVGNYTSFQTLFTPSLPTFHNKDDLLRYVKGSIREVCPPLAPFFKMGECIEKSTYLIFTKKVLFFFSFFERQHKNKSRNKNGDKPLKFVFPLSFSVRFFFFFSFFFFLLFGRAFAIAIVFPESWRNAKKPENFAFLLVLKIGQKKFFAGEKLVRGGESLVLSDKKKFAICA